MNPSLPTLEKIHIFAVCSSMMATVNIDSIQFYQTPFITPLFSSKYTPSPYIDPKSPSSMHTSVNPPICST